MIPSTQVTRMDAGGVREHEGAMAEHHRSQVVKIWATNITSVFHNNSLDLSVLKHAKNWRDLHKNVEVTDHSSCPGRHNNLAYTLEKTYVFKMLWIWISKSKKLEVYLLKNRWKSIKTFSAFKITAPWLPINFKNKDLENRYFQDLTFRKTVTTGNNQLQRNSTHRVPSFLSTFRR